MGRQTRDRVQHRRADAGGIQRKIDSVGNPVANPFVDRLAIRADRVVGAQLGGKLQPVGMQVDGNHLPRAGDPCGHDRGKTERPGAEHGKRLPRLHPEHIEHRARAGLNPAAERAQNIQGRILADP